MRRAAILCLPLLLEGCTPDTNRAAVPEESRPAVVAAAAEAEKNTVPPAAPQHGDAQAFWSEFRTAALANDTEHLGRLTRFPFTTRGSLDSDPVIEHDSTEFDALMLRLLEQPEDYQLNAVTTERDLLRATPTLDAENLSLSRDGWFRVGTFEFRRVDGAWRLTHAFTEEL
ncbi:MAG TPA: hypothetical protein VF263_23770 [Longimicrobiaceae bacterium]